MKRRIAIVSIALGLALAAPAGAQEVTVREESTLELQFFGEIGMGYTYRGEMFEAVFPRNTAVTGRAETHDYLGSLGATAFLTREEMMEPPQPLETDTWAAAVDTVGSTMLAKVLSEMKYRAVVAACGLAGGFNLPATVMPFILRGVRLQGID